jgi:hypothetical protein
MRAAKSSAPSATSAATNLANGARNFAATVRLPLNSGRRSEKVDGPQNIGQKLKDAKQMQDINGLSELHSNQAS